jgi:penicillin-binding protein 1A
VGAVVASIRDSHRIEGTSTLTQQLCKNFFLTVDRSPSRKIHEMFMAILLEQRTTKEQILTMYANDINLGSAARSIFAGSAKAPPRSSARI